MRAWAVLQVLDAKSKAEDAAATSAAVVSAAERKAKQYRGDSTALLSDYDAWVQNLLAKKSSSGSGGAAGTPLAARSSHSLTVSGNGAAAGDLGSWAGGLQSPIREGGLSRSVSQLASPAGGAGREPDLERYDRVAALLEHRGVGGSSLSRGVSGRSPSLSPGPSSLPGGIASPAGLGTRASLAGSQPPSRRVSPRAGLQ